MVRIAEVEDFIKTLDKGARFTTLELKVMMNLDSITASELGVIVRKLSKYGFVKTAEWVKIKSHTLRVWEVQ